MRIAPQEVRTFFVTSVANLRRPIFRQEPMARLLIDHLQDHRRQGHFLLHEFVIMPDHFHCMLTPAQDVSLEKAAQYIKGGFRYRARKELNYPFLVWQEGPTKHRIHDEEDYDRHREYIHNNPVKAGLCRAASDYPYSSAFPGVSLDPVPVWLKRKDRG